MADSPLSTKSKEFALQIIKVCNYVKQNKKESVLTNQWIGKTVLVGISAFSQHFDEKEAFVLTKAIGTANDRFRTDS